MEQLRRTILADQQMVASRSRFGLFSQPPPIAVGDDSQYQKVQPKRGQDGKPVTKPRQLLAGPNRSGVTKKSYLDMPSSIHQNDPFKQTFKMELKYQNLMHSRSPMHERQFVPVNCYRQKVNAAYNYIEEKQHEQKKVRKDQNGRVRTQPSNFTTNPTSKVQDKVYKPLPYMTDPYERSEQIEKQQKQIWRSKLKHEVMFKSMSHGGSNFTKDKLQYGLDERTKMLMSQKKGASHANYKRVTHDARFKPAVRGHGDPIGRYPEYVKPRERAQTEVSEKKMKTEASGQERNSWKSSYKGQSRPTPSISLMGSNCRKYL